ncbi:MAG: DUF5011 domain-containing protein [Bacteroidetes bacterium]|nr:MAG: DUF5011 domain-containing protein [Bacteroidota bacterium]
MKKQILLAAAVLFSAGMIFITGCKKDDTTGPVITITGSASEMSILNATWTDQGATAEDDEDGVVTVTSNASSTNPNKDLAGTYSIVYKATDAAGNESSATRTVTVYNEAAAFFENGGAGYSSCSETDAAGPYTYQTAKPFKVTASTTQNNRVTMNRLADFDNNTVFMDITGTSINIPSQTHTGVGIAGAACDLHDRLTSGTGTKTATGFTLTYNDSKVAPCTGTRSGVVGVFNK